MFYSQFILAKKGPLGTIWIAAHLERRLRKNQVADTDIGVSVDSIIFPEVPIALRLSSHLMVGVVRIYSRKVNYLFHDCSEALLKIKQAFRSTAVDLPPEESSAPYHSITLPETFHLDDFELPETAFQGDIDHHVSTKEQITLQDNPERTGYSTSQFGLDERFGDGNSSHIGLDLEEELLLNKDHSIQLVSDVGIIIQGQPSVPPTDMDVDDNQSKDGYNERYNNTDDGPSSHSKFNPSNTDDLGRNSVPNWNCYNIKTPDLNEMFFHNGDVAGPSASYHQPSPFPGHEPTSPEFVSAQAPATPGLMEETVPSSVHESPVPSPQRKSSSSNNDRTAKADNSVAPVSVFPHSTSANGNDVMGTAMTEPGLANPVQLDSSGTVQEADSLRQQCANEDLQFQVASQDGTPSSIHFVETSSLEAPVDKFVMDTEICKSLSILPNDNLAGSDENEAVKATAWDNGPSSKSTSELCATVTENLAQINETSVDVQGHNLHVTNATETNADLHQSIREMIPDGIPRNDKSIDLSISEFPEPEKMLLAAHIKTHEANDSWQITAEKGVTESDGSNKIGTLSSRKRRLEDSLPAVETGSPEKLSSRPQGRRTTDIIPDDDDLLASILVGKRTPGLRLGSTPLPPKVTSLKRPRIASKMVTCKRKVQMDDAVVLHADIIRQQLISIEDIRRIRKKAPCTRSEVWMIEKGSLEDEIFDEPTLSCASEELNNLHYRMYETVMHLTTQRIELQGRPDMAEAEAQDRNIGGASSVKDNPTLDHLLHTGSPNGAQSCALQPEATNAHHATAASGWSIRPEGQVDNESEALAGDTVSQGVIEPLVGSENGAKTVHNSATAGLISIPADFQKSVNIDTPLFVLDDNIPGADVNVPPDSAIGMKYAEVSTQDAVLDSSGPTYVVGNMNEELEKGVLGDFNASENKEMPTSVITGVESTQEASGFPQPTTDENAVSAMGENSGLQENNFGSFMDLDSMGHDFAPKECSDFGSAIHGVDTDFLNYDDEVDYDEADNDEPNPGEFQSLDNSGWSSRTRGVARYLKTLFDEESGLGRKSIVVDHLVSGKTRKEASRMFFETLVLKTKDYIQVEQPNPFDFVTIKPGIKLMKSDF